MSSLSLCKDTSGNMATYGFSKVYPVNLEFPVCFVLSHQSSNQHDTYRVSRTEQCVSRHAAGWHLQAQALQGSCQDRRHLPLPRPRAQPPPGPPQPHPFHDGAEPRIPDIRRRAGKSFKKRLHTWDF